MKKVVVYSYYSPEEITGIGRYNGELIKWLCQKSIEVVSITSAPFYPYWRIYKGHSNRLINVTRKDNYLDVRTFVYIPKNPKPIYKIISELSYFFSSILAWIRIIPELPSTTMILVINPPFFLGYLAFIFKSLFRKKMFTHIQDLQVDAARDLELLPEWLCRIMEYAEKILLKNSDYVSTISQGMIKKLEVKSDQLKPLLVPNWAKLNFVYPKDANYWLHNHLNIDKAKKLVVYSGNIGEKQGLELVIEAAIILSKYEDLHFVILGEGLYKKKFEALLIKQNLQNVKLGSLVPEKYLNDMLNSSFLQLVIQKSHGADLFLPSKLINILASGTCSIVTADIDTSLYDMLVPNNAAKVIPPDSGEILAETIEHFYLNPEERNEIRHNSHNLAKNNLSIDVALSPIMKMLNS